MTKKKRRTDKAGGSEGADARDLREGLRRLDARLERAHELEAKRARQLDEARSRTRELQARRDALHAVSERVPRPAPDPPAVPRGYCMREKRMVTISSPSPTVFRDGRTAIAGTCPDCGARVVTTSRAARPPA